MFEGPHLAAVADITHAAFPFLDIRTIPKGVEFAMEGGFYCRLMLTGKVWRFDWSQPLTAGPYASESHPVARRGEDPEWAVVNVAEALIVASSGGSAREFAIRTLRDLSEMAPNDSIRTSASIALHAAGI
ncbi:hypothetical protein B2G67_10375 [Microbacterium foliorum]|nr:hypothetical protein B2G67_10375 [Microbacterium foliorum]